MEQKIGRTLDFSFPNFVGDGLNSHVNLLDSESRKTQSAHLCFRDVRSLIFPLLLRSCVSKLDPFSCYDSWLQENYRLLQEIGKTRSRSRIGDGVWRFCRIQSRVEVHFC